MRAPLELRISGGGDHTFVTAHTRGLRFSKSAYGGDKGLTGTVRVPTGAFPDLNAGKAVTLHDRRTGQVLWYGDATNPGDTRARAGEAFELVCLGTANRMQAFAHPLAYILRDTDGWNRSGNSTKNASTSSEERGDGTPTLDVNAEGTIGTGWTGEWINRTLQQGGLVLGSLHMTVRSGVTDGNYQLQLRTGTSGDDLTTRAATGATEEVGSLAVTQADLGNAQDVVAFRVVRNNTTVNTTDAHWFRAWGIILKHARLTRTGELIETGYGTHTVTAGQVIDDMIGRGMCPGLNPDRVTITPTRDWFEIDALAWTDGVTMGDALGQLVAFEPDLFYMASGREARFGHFDTSRPRYVIGARHGGITRPGGGADVTCNRVLVSWTDGRGRDRVTPVTTDVEGLSYRRDYLPGVRLPDGFGTEGNARRAGEQVLAAVNAGARQGEAVIRRPIFDLWAGCDVAPWEVEPGCVAVEEATGARMKVTDTEWADDTQTMTVTLDRPPKSVEQVLARLPRRRARRHRRR